MAIEELSPDQEGRRLHVLMFGAGLDPEHLRDVLGYKHVSSVYRLLSGEQPMKLPQMKAVAKATAGKGEWARMKWPELFYYLQGGRRLGFLEGLSGDDGGLPSDSDDLKGGSTGPYSQPKAA